MPMVPVVNQNPTSTPEVGGPSVQPMRNYAPEQIQQAGETLQNAGLRQMAVSNQLALRIQEQMDDANVKAAESKFIQASSDILNGDNGYMLKQGADAVNAYGDASQALIKAKKEILDSLGNDVQKAMFNQVSQQHLVTFGARMSEHRAQQRVQYTAGEALSRADSLRTARQNADVGSADAEKYLATGVQEIINAYATKGLPADSEQVKKAIRDYRTQNVGDDITRLMVDNKYADAKSLLSEQVKSGNVDPDAADRMRATIQSNVERVQAINTADEIFATRKGLEAQDLESLLVKVDGQVKDPEMRERVRQLVTSQFSQARSIQEQKYRDNLNYAVNYKYDNGSIKGIDPVRWGNLTKKDRDAILAPPAVQNDLNTIYGFITRPDTLTVDNVKTAWSKGLLNKEGLISWTERAMAAAKQTDYVQEAGAINQRIDYFANQNGFKVYGSTSTDDKITEGTMKYRIQNEIDKVKAQNHGKITSDQVDSIIKKELTQQTLNIPRSPWNPLAIIGFPTRQEQKFTFQLPEGATMVVPGSDGKMHYSDGKNDLGVVE